MKETRKNFGQLVAMHTSSCVLFHFLTVHILLCHAVSMTSTWAPVTLPAVYDTFTTRQAINVQTTFDQPVFVSYENAISSSNCSMFCLVFMLVLVGFGVRIIRNYC